MERPGQLMDKTAAAGMAAIRRQRSPKTIYRPTFLKSIAAKQSFRGVPTTGGFVRDSVIGTILANVCSRRKQTFTPESAVQWPPMAAKRTRPDN